ncbi:MAG: hypothetical protein ACI9WS_002195 [Paraglaciecola psychrophila]|jgi:hypothetical protein
MKITVDIDLSPEEARKIMGLPDVQPMQQQILAKVQEKMEKSIDEMTNPELMMKRFLPLGAQGMEQFQKFVSGFSKASATGGSDRSKEKDSD